MSKRAIFFDRDGTVVRDTGYLRNPELIKFFPDAIRALHRLKQRGYALVLVSNQSGVGRGRISRADAQHVHEAIIGRLSKSKVNLDGAYYCFHAPDAKCECRKPSPQLLFRAADDLDIDLSSSFMIGDRLSDVEAGKRAGCFTILLGDSNGVDGLQRNWHARTWRDAEQVIEDKVSQRP